MSKAITVAPLAFLLAASLSGCGGGRTPPPTDSADEVDDSTRAVAPIRRSFEAMGGLPRLRLAAGRAIVTAEVRAGGETFPVRIAYGGSDQFRLDYPEEQVSFVHAGGTCRKTVYGVSAHCRPDEAVWVVPMRVLAGLVFPAGDAAGLGSTFRTREPIAIGGQRALVTEIRPKNTNHRIQAAYSEVSGLLARATIPIKDAADAKTIWLVDFSDWRTVDRMQVPFARDVSRDGTVVWAERAASVDFRAYDERLFLAPVPPITDQPKIDRLPRRRVVQTEIEGRRVEIPAPCPTPGGGGAIAGRSVVLPETEVVRIVHRGPLGGTKSLVERLLGGVMAEGRKAGGEPAIILLEQPVGPGEPALLILYVAVAPAGAGVKVDGL
jgi:hypothetical protein